MYKKILVPLDGSKRAEKILPHVEALAGCLQAAVIFLQVIEPTADLSTAGFLNPLADQLELDRKHAESYFKQLQVRFQENQIETQSRIVVNSCRWT
jgi:nucleotide-binding universal stress UspA family protein